MMMPGAVGVSLYDILTLALERQVLQLLGTEPSLPIE
jgi:hypothetical protein